MRRILDFAAAGMLVFAASACSGFLDSPKAVADPNNPTQATLPQLFVGVESNVFGEQEGPVAVIACEWMQQCSGVAGRFVETQDKYGISSGSFSGSFSGMYSGGGLVQIRAAEKLADDAGDAKYKGMLEVLEAMDIGFGADIWGDIPYREAAGDVAEPTFDPQQQIYDDLQKLLDQAIADLGGAGAGPGFTDLVYEGDATKWIEAAHTLKARFYLHTVEKVGAGQYDLAIAQATAGISDSTHDWKTLHSPATSERNMWAQFQTSSFGNDLVAGAVLVKMMIADNDARLPDYFGENKLGGYGGNDVVTAASDADSISPLLGSKRTDDPTFSQPIITWTENQLILAEAKFVRSGAAAALPYLNAVRAARGKPAKGPAITLADIMGEKYIELFQNVEVWNDWKRTCLPTLLPAKGKTAIPGRLLYGQTEAQTNSKTPEELPLATGRNWNDPNGC